jgi:hypothetical protein
MNLPAFSLVLLILAPSALLAQEYEVVFDHAHKAGAKCSAVCKMEIQTDQWSAVNGQRLPNSQATKTQAEITAEIEDVAVDEDGKPKETNVLIKACHFMKDDVETHVLKAGDKVHITAVKDGKPQFTVNDQPASPAVASALSFAFPTKSSDDKVFGPKHKVKIGDSWPIDKEFGEADLAKDGIPITKGALEGSVKLVSANPVNGVPCLQIQGTTGFKLKDVPLPGAPPGVNAKKFEMQVKLGTDLPQDKTVPRLSESMEMNLESIGGGDLEKNGQTATISFSMTRHQKQEVQYSPLP